MASPGCSVPSAPSPPSSGSVATSTTRTSSSSPSGSRQPGSASAAAPASTATSVSSPQGVLLIPPPGPASQAGTATSLDAGLPSPTSQRQVAEARGAIVASIGNMFDREVQGRAAMLHSNAAVIAKQERDLAKATDALRRETDKLGKLAADAARTVKELGNVQNWAEVLEREFLVLEETMRLVREGSGSESGSGSWTGSEGSWSGSGSREGSVVGGGKERSGTTTADEGRDAPIDGHEIDYAAHPDHDGTVDMIHGETGKRIDKGKARADSHHEAMEIDVSEASRPNVATQNPPFEPSSSQDARDQTLSGVAANSTPVGE